jgi:hypothetical protein
MRKFPFLEGEYYHIFNRGVDKRNIFNDGDDFQRFLTSMIEFNVIEPIGSIYENSFHQSSKPAHQKSKSKSKRKTQDNAPLVDYVAYCLNKNHFHLIVKQCVEKGIEKLMHRLGLGFTKYFNNKYDRSGSLFQGTFKSVYIQSNEQLIHVSAYVNLNDRLHKLGNLVSKSSWEEYVGNPRERLCKTEIISEQFRSPNEYKKTAIETIEEIKSRRDQNDLFLEHLET